MPRLVVRALVVLLIAAAALAVWVAHGLNDHPSLDPYRALELPPAPPIAGGDVRLTFLGVSTVLVSDGETALLIDGFFSRPGKLATLFGTIAPDAAAIEHGLGVGGIRDLAAVVVVHSHYDHAMDAPEVARRTGAVLIGSESTLNIGRGWGLAEERMQRAEPGRPLRFGAFEVTLLESAHFPHGLAMGEINAPLVPPARSLEYKEGGSYSVLIAHPLGRLLVQGSAGWRPGALDGQRADAVLLGIGGLGSESADYRDGYYRAVVEAVGARCVIPIHWDDFTLPLDQPLRPMPALLDDFDGVMAFLAERSGAQQRRLALLPQAQPVVVLGDGGCQSDRPL